MGADGGTIPKRCELVREKKKKEKIDKDIKNIARWRICQITQESLNRPIVACRLGRLFNKEAVIEALITKMIGKIDSAKHIKSLKDVKELALTDNPEFHSSTKSIEAGSVSATDCQPAPFICPVVGLEMNGNHRFVVNWNCGCVFSEKACKEIKSELCHKCGKIDMSDLVVLNGTDEEVEVYRSRLNAKRLQHKSAKNAKSDALNTTSSSELPGSSKVSEKRKLMDTKTESVDSKQAKSIQHDPSASKAYKSLFTTSDVAKNKPKSHWVTYNPLFY